MNAMKRLAMLYALTAISDMGSTKKQRIDLTKSRIVEPPLPKGCKVYYFTSNGEISDTPTDCKVIAINEKNALKKYKKL